MNERITSFRLSAEVWRDLTSLLNDPPPHPALTALPRVTRSAIARLALSEGLKVLRRMRRDR